MLEWAEIALANRPDDEFAKEKAALARQLNAELRAVNKQFNTVFYVPKQRFQKNAGPMLFHNVTWHLS